MTYGFRVTGNYGLQIDDTYHNLMMVAKGATATLSSVGAYEDVVYVGSAGCTPVLAISCTSRASIGQVTVSGNTWTWRLFVPYTPNSGTHDIGNGGVTQTPAAVNWYVFDKPPAAPTSGYGLVVWDASGNVVFDSTRKAMRVVGVLTSPSIAGYSASASFPTPATFTGVSGRAYACVYAGSRYRLHQCLNGGFWRTAYVIDGFSVNGTAVVAGDALPFYNISGSGAYSVTYYSTAAQNNLVLDVTGY